MVRTQFGPELDLYWTGPLLNVVQVQVQSCWLKHVVVTDLLDQQDNLN
jgi:hypothetical protein